MIRRLSLGGAALLAVLAVSLGGISSLPPANAQAPATPPHRFFGTLTVDGQPAAAGTALTATIGGTDCGANANVAAAGRYQIDVLSASLRARCGRGGEPITFAVGDRTATQMPTYRDGGFDQLDLTLGAGGPTPSPTPTTGFNAATLNLGDPRPCIPESGQTTCDATRTALWNGNMAAWAARGVGTDAVLIATVNFRFEARPLDPALIVAVARLLNAPYVTTTFIKFRGSAPGQTDEYVEVQNLGGREQDMSGFAIRSPRGPKYNFPEGFVLAPGVVCRVYTGAPQSDSCGGTSFNSTDVWPDDAGNVELFLERLALPGTDFRYSANPANQPPAPSLTGVNAP